jgi:hypothetical protein
MVKHDSRCKVEKKFRGQGLQTESSLSYLNVLPSHGLQFVEKIFGTDPGRHALQ